MPHGGCVVHFRNYISYLTKAGDSDAIKKADNLLRDFTFLN
jgi:hypothetical protein